MAPDPYRYFRLEARELLEQLGQGALDLEKVSAPQDLIARLLRFAHTLKGAARVVRQPEIADDAHLLEDLFAALRDSESPGAPRPIDQILAALDRMTARVAALEGDAEAAAPAAVAATERVEMAVPIRPDRDDAEDVLRAASAAGRHLAALRPQIAASDDMWHVLALIDGQIVGRDTTRGPIRAAQLRSLVDELRGRLGAFQRAVTTSADQIDREIREIGEAASRLRLVPAASIFRFLERAARDASQALGKSVAFEARGGDIRLDAETLGLVQGALLHLVRNAVAHGIESPAARAAAGKPATGRVTLRVARRGSAIAFLCEDDGAGIDREAVRERLRRKGIAGAADAPPDRLLALLLESGISTSSMVSDVSGRGIGLDVVRDAAARLGGSATLRSEPGVGTTAALVIPATLMAFEALLCEAAGVPAAVPLEAVRCAVRVEPDDIIRTPSGDSLLVGGDSLPLIALGRLVRPAAPPPSHTQSSSAIVVMAETGAVACLVDRVAGTGSIVARPLPAGTPRIPAIAAATIDPSGAARVILDPAAIVAEAQRAHPLARPAPAEPPCVLVVDDSLTTRMLEASILESAGYRVALATSGEEGLEKARAGGHALVLVDVEMPGMDGFTFIEHLRADPALRDLPAILVTSRGSVADRQRGRDAGAQDYMVKSDFDQAALLARIRTLVR